MDEPLPFYRDPVKQIYLVLLVALFIFILLLGHQGIARDVLVDEDYAYLATGDTAGVRVLSLSNPLAPVDVGGYDTPGTAKELTKAGPLLFVADGEGGLRILDVTDPKRPALIGTLNTSGDTQDIAISGNLAFLADGTSGLLVVDISKPAHPLIAGSLNSGGTAQGVAVAETPFGMFVVVANGSKGLMVVDPFAQGGPAQAGRLGGIGNAKSVVTNGSLAFVTADNALIVANISNPTQPLKVGELDLGADAKRLALVGQKLYIANGSKGLAVVSLANDGTPKTVNSMEAGGFAYGVSVKGRDVYLAVGDQGVKILDPGFPESPVVGSYETPGEATIGQIISGLFSIVRGRLDMPQKVWTTLLAVFFDLVLFFVVIAFWLAVFSQFILPVRNLEERKEAINRVFSYHTGFRGPAVFIENGKIREREREQERIGPGVALLDTASAAVFRKAHSFTRPVGPGIVFTRVHEYIAGIVDLHKQSTSLGPRENEDPFAPKGENESADAFQDRQQHRYETSSLTRDGVEVIPSITTTFSLNSTPGEGGSQFGYNAQAVWKAIAREGINPIAVPGSDKRHVPWDWLPVHMAVDLWREYLRKFTLDELFTFSDAPQLKEKPSERKTAFDIILASIRARMMNPEVEELDELGQPTGIRTPSKEYQILQERGIRMAGINVRKIALPASVEGQIVEQWKATWLKRAQDEAKDVERYLAEKRNEGQDLALKEFAIGSSQLLARVLVSDTSIGPEDSLNLLAQGTLLLTHDPELQQRLTNQRAILVELVEWIRKQLA